jgi:predicted RND superfamily exporter protein
MTLLLTLVAFAGSAGLKMDMRWTALLPESLPAVKEFLAIDREHEDSGGLIVTVSVDPGAVPDRAERRRILESGIDAVADALAPEVCPRDLDREACAVEGKTIRGMVSGTPMEFLERSLLRVAPAEEAEGLAGVLAAPSVSTLLMATAAAFDGIATTDAPRPETREMALAQLDALEDVLVGLDDGALGPQTTRRLLTGTPIVASPDQTMALVMLAPIALAEDAEALPALDKRVEELLAPTHALVPDASIERTGLATIARDELESMEGETTLLTLVALVVILVMLMLNFRKVSAPLLAVAPVLLGITWTMGALGLLLGTLNLMTAMIMIVLLGLGVDFSIHLIGRFDEERSQGADVEQALSNAFVETGSGVVTGGVSTAAAFFALTFADMRGIHEFGVAASVGVLLSLAATFQLLPVLLLRTAAKQAAKGRGVRAAPPLASLGRLASIMGKRPALVAVAFGALCAGAALAGRGIQWEENLMELEPVGLRSIELQDEIIERFGISTVFSRVTTETAEESRALAERLRALDSVGRVDEVGSMISPPEFGRNRSAIQGLRAALDAPSGVAPAPAPAPLHVGVKALEAPLRKLVNADLSPHATAQAKRLLALPARERLSEPGAADAAALETAGEDVRALAGILSASDEPITVETLPPDLRALYVGRDTGRLQLRILPTDNIWEGDALETFRVEVEGVTDRVTGIPQLVVAMNDMTVAEGRRALLLSSGLIALMLIIHFRRPLPVILAALPLIAGATLAAGGLTLLDQKLNFLNVIALPVLLGIGVDNGVHLMHRVLEEGKGKIPDAVAGVGRSVLVSSLTTMVGFGSLAFYLHRGMASLGIALFVGVGACLVVTLTLLPALCSLFEGALHRGAPPAE